MNQYVRTSLGVAIIVIMAVTIGFFSWIYYKNNLVDETALPTPPINSPRACTEEAKICPDGSAVGRKGLKCEFEKCPEIVGIENKIVITSLKLGDTIASPLMVSGRAVGGWFFEGSFPVSIEDDNGRVLGKGIAEFFPSYPGEEWMTTNFVNFTAELKFSAPSSSSGYVIFTKDNPSGNPALDETFRLPVKFGNSADISSWKTYKNEKYGFEFQYPKNNTPLSAIDDKSEKIIPASNLSEVVRIVENEKMLFCCEASGLGIAFKNENMSSWEWLEKNQSAYFDESEKKEPEKIIFSGKEAFKINGEGNIGSNYQVMAIKIDAGLLVIVQNVNDQFSNNILSTFKFTK